MHGLALALLVWWAVAAVWDLLDPDALTVKLNSPFRGVCSVAGAAAAIVLVCLVLSISTPWIVAIMCGVLVAAAITYAVNN